MKKRKQILAWIGIVFLLALYLATFVFAMIGSDWAYNMFKMCLGATIVVPALLYGYQLIYRVLNKGNEEKDND